MLVGWVLLAATTVAVVAAARDVPPQGPGIALDAGAMAALFRGAATGSGDGSSSSSSSTGGLFADTLAPAAFESASVSMDPTRYRLDEEGNAVRPFLIPRVAGGTPGSAAVQAHIAQTFASLGGWTVERDAFVDDTPFGRKPFTNIVATKNPRAPRKLVLAAHYDSKYFDSAKDPNHLEFVGATDSAVPCAILVALAKALNPLLDAQDPLAHTTLQLIFFDGEEAFVDWTNSDSLYGSRHLAERWQSMPDDGSLMDATATVGKQAEATAATASARETTSRLRAIDAFVLLDLLGDASSTFVNMNPDTAWLWARLVDIERRLATAGLLSASDKAAALLRSGTPAYFVPGAANAHQAVDDDHRPFKTRGVPIVHVIAVPFPKTWHTTLDDGDHVNPETASDLARIFALMIVEYLGLF
ncbi:hypothetical protein HDU84_008861 [Entophlyctis sp. JEL0112]|nr:hypothetical protein HDU84_008861 [Entophlyctis sp. JEL0112]